jgi:hypothetical protein
MPAQDVRRLRELDFVVSDDLVGVRDSPRAASVFFEQDPGLDAQTPRNSRNVVD